MEYEKKNKDAISTIKQALRQLSTNGVPVGNIIKAIKDIEEKYAESDDERIRGNVIATIHLYYGEPLEDEAKEMIAWLEKQCEQKLYVNDNAKEMFIKALERVEEQNKKGYKLTDCDKNSWWEDFKAYTSCIIEQKPASWSKEDEKQARRAVEIAREELMEEFIGKAITFLEGAHEYIDDKKLQLQYDNEGLIRDFRQFMRE